MSSDPGGDRAIIPWDTVHKHEFGNLIALCPTCHTRYDQLRTIDRMAMFAYKANLSILNNRYSDMERRLLKEFAEDPSRNVVDLTGNWSIVFKYLLLDGLFVSVPGVAVAEMSMDDGSTFPLNERYAVTPKGRAFVAALRDAQPVEAMQVIDESAVEDA